MSNNWIKHPHVLGQKVTSWFPFPVGVNLQSEQQATLAKELN